MRHMYFLTAMNPGLNEMALEKNESIRSHASASFESLHHLHPRKHVYLQVVTDNLNNFSKGRAFFHFHPLL
jgi:hypothetical protein